MDPNQGEPTAGTPGTVGSVTPEPYPLPAAAAPSDTPEAAAARRTAAETLGGAVHRGLLLWMAIVLGGATLALVFQRPDAALFLALATLFALAQSWDARDRARAGELANEPALAPGTVGTALRALVPLAIPLVAVMFYTGIGVYARGLEPTPRSLAAMRWSWAAAAACLAMTLPPISRGVARAFLARSADSYTARLSASIALALLLLPVPFRLLADPLLAGMTAKGQPLVDVDSLVVQLGGELVLAVGAVGLWVARDPRAVRDRLGLGGIGLRHLIVAGIGLAAVVAVNGGMEALEHARFPALWAADQDMTRRIAGSLTVGASVLLGVSAGVGEELLVRGALQPRAGLVWASVLFAAAHVQYTWFGMVTIALLGVTLGLVRRHANTTTAILVHAAYDMIAALGTR